MPRIAGDKLLRSSAAILLASCLGVLAPTGAKPKPEVRSTPVAPERALEFTYQVRVPELPAGSRQLNLWIPLPSMTDRYQEVSDLKIDSPLGWRASRSASNGNRMAYFQIDAAHGKAPVAIEVHFRVVRHEYRVALPGSGVTPSGAVPAVPQGELARFLEADRMVPLNGVIAELSQEQTQGISDPMAKARKIYEYVVATMRYDKSGSGWGHGDAVWACSSHRGNCTDFHSVFIGMARAAGIPARFEIGFPLPEDRTAADIPGYHCWAEFYAQGLGWVPVDASEAWKHPDRHDYYFGALDPDRVMFSRGRDLRLDPPQRGEALNYFVYPYAELDGKPFDGLTNKLSFRDIASEAAAGGRN